MASRPGLSLQESISQDLSPSHGLVPPEAKVARAGGDGWGGMGSDVRWELLGTSSHDIMTLRYV